MSPAATSRSAVSISRLPSMNAGNIASLTTASSSAPTKPSVARAIFDRSKRSRLIVMPLRSRCTCKICSRSCSVGRSRKNTSLNRPLRRSSGGSRSIEFAVANTNTGARFSCIHVRNVASTRLEVPLSPLDPAKAFSISSTHSTQGAITSAICIASRIFFSEAPTRPPKTAPISRRNSGSFHMPAATLAHKLLPVPGMPINATPRGASRPYSRASCAKAS